MRVIARLLFAILPLALPGGALAQRQSFTVDPGTSHIAFSLGATGHDVHGTFHVQSGSVDFDRTTATISGSVVVAAGSGESGNTGRDQKMHNDVLDVANFAQITFGPRSYQGTIAPSGDSQIQVSGDFTLHGSPHNITVPVQIHIDGANLTAKAHMTVPYVQWGLKDPSVFILKVSKEVGIDVTLAGRVTP
jgi:polyisoprenoid-binding protein YceI